MAHTTNGHFANFFSLSSCLRMQTINGTGFDRKAAQFERTSPLVSQESTRSFPGIGHEKNKACPT